MLGSALVGAMLPCVFLREMANNRLRMALRRRYSLILVWKDEAVSSLLGRFAALSG